MPAATVVRGWEGRGPRRLGQVPPFPQMTPPVAGYIAHYDPSDVSTVTVSAAGLITALADKVGSFNSTAVVGFPTLIKVPGLFNDRPIMNFEGAATSIATGVGMSDTTMSVFAVCRCLANAASRNPCVVGPSADDALEIRINNAAADLKITALEADVLVLGDNDAFPITLGTPFVMGCLLSATDVTLYNNLNGETDAVVAAFTAGRTLVIGRAPTVAGDTERWLGQIGELIFYGTTLSGADALLNINYLMSKWGIVA